MHDNSKASHFLPIISFQLVLSHFDINASLLNRLKLPVKNKPRRNSILPIPTGIDLLNVYLLQVTHQSFPTFAEI